MRYIHRNKINQKEQRGLSESDKPLFVGMGKGGIIYEGISNIDKTR